MASVLGIHRDPWHDTGAALVYTNLGKRQLVSVSEERLDRVKDSRNYPEKSIQYCLQDACFDSFDDINLFCADFIQNKTWNDDIFKKKSVSDPHRFDCQHNINGEPKLRLINHHLCHAASAAYTSGYREATVLVVDGRGSNQETQSIYSFENNSLKLLEQTTDIGIGLLYASITQSIGFKLLQEGKTMGLAPYGKALFEEYGPVIDFKGHFEGVSTDYSAICNHGTYDLLDVSYRNWSELEKRIAAYQVQLECERAMLHLAGYARSLTGLRNLCITGGVALNSVANKKILDARLFDSVYINPCCSDTGIALGSALYGYHVLLDQPYLETTTTTAFIGKRYSNDQVKESITSSIDDANFKVDCIKDKTLLANTAARLLDENKVVGICCGRSEIGPRALGNRSIMMSARIAGNKDILNSRVKHREAYRPFAPICLYEYADQYFDIEQECRYMLFVPLVHKDKRAVIPAVTHVDGSARLQTVSHYEQSFTRDLLLAYYVLTKIPVLINTSFNDNNEPIVETPDDAIKSFQRCNLDALIFDNYLITKLL